MRRALALLLLCFTMPAGAQQASAPEPLLRVTIDPPRVVVGQGTVLQIDVLAPNYMTKPPVLPDFQLRNAMTRAGSTINLSEQRDGTTYAGVRFEFLIYPQEPGSYAIGGQKVAITYAAAPPATREAELPVPRVALEAFIPDGAQMLDPFVSATALKLRQEVRRSSDPLKVGDAVTRTVTIEAEGTPAMLLPPTAFAAIDGMKFYPEQPNLQDRVDRRTDRLSSTRTEHATYMLERPGDFELPAVEVAWWNVREQRFERTRTNPIAFHVAENPALKAEAPPVRNALPSLRSIVAFVAEHWLAILTLFAVLIALAWVVPRFIRAIRLWREQRRNRYLMSEACAFANVSVMARSGDAGKLYFAMLNWLPRFEPAAPGHTIADLRNAARDQELDRELAAIERYLFGVKQDDVVWSASSLVRHVARIRRRLLRKHFDRPAALPSDLNPRPVQFAPIANRYRVAR